MSTRGILLCLIAAAAIGTTGCASSPFGSGEAREVAELLDYYARLNDLAPDEQRREYTAAQAAFERQAGDAQRLRLALVLLLPRAPWRDDARVLHLLGSVEPAATERPSPRRDLTLLLQKLVGERQRQLRDEHRKTDDLQQKLDALRAIDRESRQKAPRR